VCYTTSASLAGNSLSVDYTNPQDYSTTYLSSTSRFLVKEIGTTAFHYIYQEGGVLYTAPLKAEGDDAFYKFHDIFKTEGTSYSMLVDESKNAYPTPILGYDDGLIVQNPWLIVKSPINKRGWVGFGNGFETNAPIYKSLTTQSFGQTWASSNLLKTGALGAQLEHVGPQAVHTGCRLSQDGTTSWFTPSNTQQSSTQSTLLATYSSTVVDNLAGGGSRSVRADKFVTYVLGLSEPETAKTTVLGQTDDFILIEYNTGIRDGAYNSPSPTLYINWGRDNTFSSQKTIYLSAGVDISTTRVSSNGGKATGSMRVTNTNATATRIVDDFAGSFSVRTYSMYSMAIPQGVGYNLKAELLYKYGQGLQNYRDVIPYVSNQNLYNI
jgi:hypothetical protein